MADQPLPAARAQLATDLAALGLGPDQMVMLHSSVKAIGPVMGGPNTIIQALLDTLTPTGTLMMYAGWQDIPDFIDDLPPDQQRAYRAHHPAFDPAIARAVRENSILAEFVRTWPGARRSANPEASMVALGARAAWLTADHPLNYGYGRGSPLEKLVASDGRVLLLGAPLDTITLLHYAEYCARLRHKQIIHYACPILRDGAAVWVEIEDYDTGREHDAYTLGMITSAYLDARGAARGRVGAAEALLFRAADLTRFAIDWLEERFAP